MQKSEYNAQLTSLMKSVKEMMHGDDKAAILWLNTPNSIFGNKSPIEHAATHLGLREVEDLIRRIRHGVFS